MKIIPFIQQKLANHNAKISNTLSILSHIAKSAPQQQNKQLLQTTTSPLRGTALISQAVQPISKALQEPKA
jgi:CMP-N-acetylneuraminic acid synthetase